MAITNNREISLRQVLLAKSCIHSALTSAELRHRASAMHEDTRGHKRLVKDVARKLLSDNQVKAERQVRTEVGERSLSEQKDIIRQARKIAEARISGLEEGDDVEMSVQQRWYDSETGWTILFQPNRVETLSDEDGDYVRVIGWTDSKRISFHQKELARMFGLLQFIQERGEMRIKMVFESLTRDATLWEEWLDSPEDALVLLKDMQETIGRIEEARTSDKVPPRSHGKHCMSCPVKMACRQGYKFLVREGFITPSVEPTSPAPVIAQMSWMRPAAQNNKSFRKAA